MARPGGLEARLARERAAGRPRRLRGLLVALFFAAAAFGSGAIAPVTTWRCERAVGGAVTCVVRQRSLGLLTLREQRLAGVTAVGDEEQLVDVYSGGTTLQAPPHRMVVRDAGGRSVPLTRWDESSSTGEVEGVVGSATPSELRVALLDLLHGDGPALVAGWRAPLAPLPIGGVLLLLAVVMLGLAALSLSPRATEGVYAAAGRLAAAADARAAAEQTGALAPDPAEPVAPEKPDPLYDSPVVGGDEP